MTFHCCRWTCDVCWICVIIKMQISIVRRTPCWHWNLHQLTYKTWQNILLLEKVSSNRQNTVVLCLILYQHRMSQYIILLCLDMENNFMKNLTWKSALTLPKSRSYHQLILLEVGSNYLYISICLSWLSHWCACTIHFNKTFYLYKASH